MPETYIDLLSCIIAKAAGFDPDMAAEPIATWACLADTTRDDLWTEDGSCKAMQFQWPLPNVWLGVSAEDQARADERIPDLLATPAAVRFVSAEPLLGPIDFSRFGPLDQIIVGGESGDGFRPMQIEWAESIMRQCRKTGTAFFFKQDSHHRSGQRGRASPELWACKQMPEQRNG